MAQEAKDANLFKIKMMLGQFASIVKDLAGFAEGEEIKLSEEYKTSLEKVDLMEKKVRIGTTEAKVIGEKSVNKQPVFSKRKSMGVKKVQISKDPVFDEKNHGER